jgi:putative lipoprotein
MGKGGEPTKIDFNKNFAIAYILPQTNRKTDLAPLSLTLKKKRLELQYKLEQGKAQTYFTQPFFIIVVDKKYVDYNIVEIKGWD